MDTSERFESFVILVTQAYRNLCRIKTTEMEDFGLKGNIVMTLFYLHRNPQGLSPKELTDMCFEDKAAVSRTLASLEERGYVMTKGAAKYKKKYLLTDEGKKVTELVEQKIASNVLEAGKNVTEEERDIFYKVLKAINTNLSDGSIN